MMTSELIAFLSTKPFTENQAYNLLIDDIYESVNEEEIALPASQKLVTYFMYKIQGVLLPAINEVKTLNRSEQGSKTIPTNQGRLVELTGKMEVTTTDGDLSSLTQDDIGDIYSWLLWAGDAR